MGGAGLCRLAGSSGWSDKPAYAVIQVNWNLERTNQIAVFVSIAPLVHSSRTRAPVGNATASGCLDSYPGAFEDEQRYSLPMSINTARSRSSRLLPVCG